MEYYRTVGQKNVQLYAVSVDPPEVSEALRKRLNIDFTFLSDPDATVLDALGIRHREGHDGKDIAFPTQILVDRDGVVRWIYASQTFRARARPEDVFVQIARLDG